MALSKEGIEEELLNHDLINSGGVENQVHLQQMNLEEKKNLLKGIKQSKESERVCDPALRSISQSVIDTSPSNFPSLQTAGKNNVGKNKLKLPRKQSSGPKASDSEDSSDKCITLFDDEECTIKRFNLPFFVDDDAPDLTMPERPFRRMKNQYYVMKNESPAVALKRMLNHHDTWKAAYMSETRRIESNALLEKLEDCESKGSRDSPKTHKVEEKENDPYIFSSGSPAPLPKVYNGRKRETNLSSDNTPHQSGRQLQRKTSRDSDCEEVETILKPEEPKLGDWITTTRSKATKRNRKQLFSQDKGQSYENSPDVEFEFEEKWDSGSSTWQNAQQSPSSSSLNNQVQGRRALSNPPAVEEEKVQCPICQRNFPQSKVENHAATCEGFSGSPMDIEEEQD